MASDAPRSFFQLLNKQEVFIIVRYLSAVPWDEHFWEQNIELDVLILLFNENAPLMPKITSIFTKLAINKHEPHGGALRLTANIADELKVIRHISSHLLSLNVRDEVEPVTISLDNIYLDVIRYCRNLKCLKLHLQTKLRVVPVGKLVSSLAENLEELYVCVNGPEYEPFKLSVDSLTKLKSLSLAGYSQLDLFVPLLRACCTSLRHIKLKDAKNPTQDKIRTRWAKVIETLFVYCRRLREIEFVSDFQFKPDYFNLLISLGDQLRKAFPLPSNFQQLNEVLNNCRHLQISFTLEQHNFKEDTSTILAPHAETVSLIGDFFDWEIFESHANCFINVVNFSCHSDEPLALRAFFASPKMSLKTLELVMWAATLNDDIVHRIAHSASNLHQLCMLIHDFTSLDAICSLFQTSRCLHRVHLQYGAELEQKTIVTYAVELLRSLKPGKKLRIVCIYFRTLRKLRHSYRQLISNEMQFLRFNRVCASVCDVVL